jgi:hypothetical protein
MATPVKPIQSFSVKCILLIIDGKAADRKAGKNKNYPESSIVLLVRLSSLCPVLVTN